MPESQFFFGQQAVGSLDDPHTHLDFHFGAGRSIGPSHFDGVAIGKSFSGEDRAGATQAVAIVIQLDDAGHREFQVFEAVAAGWAGVACVINVGGGRIGRIQLGARFCIVLVVGQVLLEAGDVNRAAAKIATVFQQNIVVERGQLGSGSPFAHNDAGWTFNPFGGDGWTGRLRPLRHAQPSKQQQAQQRHLAPAKG